LGSERQDRTYTTLVASNGLGKCLWTLVDNDVSPTFLTWDRRVDGLAGIVDNDWEQGLGLETWFTLLTLDGRAVDGDISEVGEELLSSVLGCDELEQLGCVVDEGSPGLSGLKYRVSEQSDDEGDVGLTSVSDRTAKRYQTHLDTSDTELYQSSDHLPPCNFISRTTDRALDEQRVVVRGDLRSGVT
jgi:hypothetical protein